jgi:hypothetical protein
MLGLLLLCTMQGGGDDGDEGDEGEEEGDEGEEEGYEEAEPGVELIVVSGCSGCSGGLPVQDRPAGRAVAAAENSERYQHACSVQLSRILPEASW